MHKKGNRIYNVLYFLLTLAWIAFIFSFSLQTGEASSELSGGIVSKVLGVFLPEDFICFEELEFFVRKLAHFTEYFVLGVLMFLSVNETSVSRKEIVAIALCVLVASVDETIQLFSIGRSGNVLDVLLDGMGSLVGVISYKIVINWIKHKVIVEGS